MNKAPDLLKKLVSLFFPIGGLAISIIYAILLQPIFAGVLLAFLLFAYLLLLILTPSVDKLIRLRNAPLQARLRLRLLCFALLLLSVMLRPFEKLLIPEAAFAVLLIAGVSDLVRNAKTDAGHKRISLDIARFVLFMALTAAGFFAFRSIGRSRPILVILFFAFLFLAYVFLALLPPSINFLSRLRKAPPEAHLRPRLLCFVLLMLAILLRPAEIVLVPAAFAVLLIGGVSGLIRAARTHPGFERISVETAWLVILIALTGAGFFSFRIAVKVQMNSPSGCSGIPANCRLIANDIDAPYEIYAWGDNKIVTAYAGVHFIDGRDRRTSRPEFGAAVRDYFDPIRMIFAGGGNGTRTAFIYKIDAAKFLFRRAIAKNDIMDADYYDGKYYLLSENGDITTIDEKTRTAAVHKNLLLLAYSLRINKRTGKMYMASWGSGLVLKMDARTFKEEARENFWSPSYRVEVNEDENTVLVSQPLRSRILELDGKTLRPLRTLQTGLGVRDIQLAPDKGIVYAANTFEGTFTETDYETGNIINRYMTGPNTRGIYYDPATRRKYAVSRCGAFEITDKPKARK